MENLLDKKEIPKGSVLLFFYADWLPYGKKFHLILEKLEPDFPDIKFISIDVDILKDVTEDYKVKKIPTFIFMKDKKIIHKMIGDQLSTAIKAFLYKNMFKTTKNYGNLHGRVKQS
jgi:thioredoxin 1